MNVCEVVVDIMLLFGGGYDGNLFLFIKKGMFVMYNVYVMYWNLKVYGMDVDCYVLERWEVLCFGWDFFLFNGGLCVCIGCWYFLNFFNVVLLIVFRIICFY